MKKNTLKNTITACALAGMLTLGSTVSEAALGDRTLYRGMTHPDVKELQTGLKKLGYYDIAIDNIFGKGTKTAVQKFQKANGLVVDGIFGAASTKALKNNLNGNSKAPAKPKQEAPSQSVKSNSNGQLTYTRLLKLGSKGNDVKELQTALKKLGHYNMAIDTIFGNGARNAVMSFQRAQKLSVDGVVGPATIKTLNDVLSGKVAAGKPSSQPSRNDSGKSTTINIVNLAKGFVGSRYVYGGSSPSGFDCSGFTQYVYKQMGINIPRATTGQANVGKSLSKSELQAGDLLIFSNTYKPGPSHVGVYIGNGQFVHASTPSKGVRVDNVNTAYYTSKFTSGRRVY